MRDIEPLLLYLKKNYEPEDYQGILENFSLESILSYFNKNQDDFLDSLDTEKIVDYLGIDDIVKYADNTALLNKIDFNKKLQWWKANVEEEEVLHRYLMEDIQKAISEIGVFEFQKVLDGIIYPHLVPKSK